MRNRSDSPRGEPPHPRPTPGPSRASRVQRAPQTVASDAAQRVPDAEAIPAVQVRIRVNGRLETLVLDPRTTLLDALRECLRLMGTKKGCDRGQCGACTVLVNGRRVNACLALAAAQDGRDVTTIEGLASEAGLHPVQAAFVARDAFQCGYCTPGQIMSCVALLAESEGEALDDGAIREGLAGNVCRCGAYVNIVAAVRDVLEGR